MRKLCFAAVVLVLLSLAVCAFARAGSRAVAGQVGRVTVAVYWDKNGDGTRGKGEPLVKWPVELYSMEEGFPTWLDVATTTPAPVVWAAAPQSYLIAAAVPIPEEWGFTTPSEALVTITDGEAPVVLFGVDKPNMK